MRASFQLLIFILCAITQFASVDVRAGFEVTEQNINSVHFHVAPNTNNPDDILEQTISWQEVTEENLDQVLIALHENAEKLGLNEKDQTITLYDDMGAQRSPSDISLWQKIKEKLLFQKFKTNEIKPSPDVVNATEKTLKEKVKILTKPHKGEQIFLGISVSIYRFGVAMNIWLSKGLTLPHAIGMSVLQSTVSFLHTRYSPFLDDLFAGLFTKRGSWSYYRTEEFLRFVYDWMWIEVYRFFQYGGSWDALWNIPEQANIAGAALLINRFGAKIGSLRNSSWRSNPQMRNRIGFITFLFTIPFSMLEQAKMGEGWDLTVMGLKLYEVHWTTPVLIGAYSSVIWTIKKKPELLEQITQKLSPLFEWGKNQVMSIGLVSDGATSCKGMTKQVDDLIKSNEEYFKRVQKAHDDFAKQLLDWKDELNRTK